MSCVAIAENVGVFQSTPSRGSRGRRVHCVSNAMFEVSDSSRQNIHRLSHRRRQRRRVYVRFTVAARVVYSTLHSARTTHTHARPALRTRAQTCVLGTKILSTVHFARFASYCAGVQVFICNACICGISSERTSCTLRVRGRPWSQTVVARLACERGTHAGGGAALGGGGNSHPVSFE